MEVTEELLQEMKKSSSNFSDGIILPDGDYRLLEKGGHLGMLLELVPYSEDEVWKMVPQGDSILFWMIEKTGCVLTDYNSTVGMTMTGAQKKVFDALVKNGFLTEQYCDLTNQRRKVREKLGQQVHEA